LFLQLSCSEFTMMDSINISNIWLSGHAPYGGRDYAEWRVFEIVWRR
jgi:hypothetical protein